MGTEYDFTHERRGSAILINNVDFVGAGKRQGSDADMRILQEAFTTLGFDPNSEIFTHRNVKTHEMLQSLIDSAKHDDHENSDCLICAILTHGDQGTRQQQCCRSTEMVGDLVCGIDGAVPLSELIKTVIDCPGLQGKPKIFIVQACRGQRFSEAVRVEHVESRSAPVARAGTGATAVKQPTDSTDILTGGVLSPREEQDEESRPFTDAELRDLERMPQPVPADLPVYNDCLVVYATQPGFFAFRNKNTGSPFIKAFCNQVRENGTTMDLMSLLTRVNRDVAYGYTSSADRREQHGKKMMPWIATRLTKDIVFGEKMDMT